MKEGNMLITGRRVVTGPGQHLDDGAVLVDGELIAAVGPRAEVEKQAPTGVPRFDFDGTVLPGLIDAHVHLAFDGGADPVGALQESTDDQLLEAMRQRAERLLLSGVTTARDLGDRNGLAFALAAEIEEGRTLGPRLIAAGTPITSVGGHCHFLGGEVSGARDARELVRRNLTAGAGVIKVMVSGGGLTKGGPRSFESQFTAEEIAVVVAEAHEAGVPVAAHAHGADAIAASVAAGVDTIEHCTWMTDGGLDLRPDVLRQIIGQDIAVCAAVSPHWRMLPAIFGEEQAAAMFDLIRTMADAGARLIAGTDAGVQRAGFDGLASALTFYSHLGLEAAAIIDMATSGAAEALGLGSVTGRVSPGYRADLLVVDGDPLTDLGTLGEARAVVAAGRMHVSGS